MLARRLAAALELPYIGKDDIKERLFDTLGWSDRDWSRKLGGATYEILFLFAERLLAAGQPLLLESNFRPAINGARLVELQARYAAKVCQVICWTEPGVLLERIRRRGTSGERHPGHVEHLHYAEMVPRSQEDEYGPLPLGGPVIHVDTTDFERVDDDRIVSEMRAEITRISLER